MQIATGEAEEEYEDDGAFTSKEGRNYIDKCD